MTFLSRKSSAVVAAVTVVSFLVAMASAEAQSRKRVTVRPAVNPAVMKLVRQGVEPDIARMIVASRNTTADGSPLVPNATMYEYRQWYDTISGVPQSVSGSPLKRPWVDRYSGEVRQRAGMRY